MSKKWDYYFHRGTHPKTGDPTIMGEPDPLDNWFWYWWFKWVGYRVTKVPHGTRTTSIILQAVINQKAHPSSTFCQDAIVEHCDPYEYDGLMQRLDEVITEDEAYLNRLGVDNDRDIR